MPDGFFQPVAAVYHKKGSVIEENDIGDYGPAPGLEATTCGGGMVAKGPDLPREIQRDAKTMASYLNRG
jgi:hypothetical protein